MVCVQAGPGMSGRRRPECVGAVGVIEAFIDKSLHGRRSDG